MKASLTSAVKAGKLALAFFEAGFASSAMRGEKQVFRRAQAV
jgi:hypothetical protein